jgi:hypothetical protein
MEREEDAGESAATLDRRRETLIKKGKEYHKELDTLLVCTAFIFHGVSHEEHTGKYVRRTLDISFQAHQPARED